jgi:hypothetical protein
LHRQGGISGPTWPRAGGPKRNCDLAGLAGLDVAGLGLRLLIA